MSTTNKYTKEARQTLVFAKEEAQRLRHRAISPEHLLLGLLRVNDILIENIFESLHLNTPRVTQAIEFVIGRGNKVHLSDPALNAAARYVIANAEVEAARAASDLIGIERGKWSRCRRSGKLQPVPRSSTRASRTTGKHSS